MRFHVRFYHTIIVLFLVTSSSLTAQPWTFIREKDGIRLFTSQQEGSTFKSFHGEVEFHGDFDKVTALLVDTSQLEWWPDMVKNIRVLFFERDRQIGYYFEYYVPWPFYNRDLVARVQISEDPASGVITIYSTPLSGAVSVHPGLVRVTDYWQRWILEPLENGMVHITLEGYIDPAGDLPAWLYNIVVVDIPERLLQSLRDQAKTGGGEMH